MCEGCCAELISVPPQHVNRTGHSTPTNSTKIGTWHLVRTHQSMLPVADLSPSQHGPTLLTSRQKYACPLSVTCPLPALSSTIAVSPALRVLDWVISRSPENREHLDPCGAIRSKMRRNYSGTTICTKLQNRYTHILHSVSRLPYFILYNKCGSGQSTDLPVVAGTVRTSRVAG